MYYSMVIERNGFWNTVSCLRTSFDGYVACSAGGVQEDEQQLAQVRNFDEPG